MQVTIVRVVLRVLQTKCVHLDSIVQNNPLHQLCVPLDTTVTQSHSPNARFAQVVSTVTLMISAMELITLNQHLAQLDISVQT